MAFDPLTGILNIGGKLIDKLLPDPEAKAKAKLDLAVLAQDGELKELETRVLILAAIPMGFLTAYNPEVAKAVTTGMQNWLAAIPDPMWQLFGAGYLGYTGAREFGKHSKNKYK